MTRLHGGRYVSRQARRGWRKTRYHRHRGIWLTINGQRGFLDFDAPRPWRNQVFAYTPPTEDEKALLRSEHPDQPTQ
jgi:hypothetical protein